MKQPSVLKVADIDELVFNLTYGDYMRVAYPNTRIEIVATEPNSALTSTSTNSEPATIKRWAEFVRTEQPDLLIIRDDAVYRALSDEGLLADLSPYMHEEGGIDETIHPGVIELMKQNRDGRLYGVAPSFIAGQLYYNEDLFREFGIDPPHDGMTWAELLAVAFRFTAASASADGPIGYYEPWSEPLALATKIGETEGLSMYRLATGRMTVDSAAWRSVFEQVLSSYSNGTFRSLTPEEQASAQEQSYYDVQQMNDVDLFAQGKAAMTVTSLGRYRTDNLSFKLGAVNPPVDEATRTRSGSFIAGDRLAIRSGSPHAESSWRFIQFMVSDYVAQASAGRIGDSGTSSNRNAYRYIGDENAASVYRQLPALLPYDEGGAAGEAFYEEMQHMLKQEIADTLADKQSIDEMLERMQQQGQQLIDEERAERGR